MDSEQKQHISRIIQRKRDSIILGVWTTLDGKRYGTDVVVPKEFDEDRIKRVLDHGEEALAEQVANYLAQKTLTKA